MAWNEPGGGRNDDPWGGGGDQGPPDLDEAFRKLQQQLGGIFGRGGSGGSGAGGGGLSAGWLAALAGIALLTWVGLGFYTVGEVERAVVFRFGVLQEDVRMPGLRWRPLGIDTVVPVVATRQQSIEHAAKMLTEDRNIVDVDIEVQYVVDDPKAYVVQVRNPVNSLEQALESALRHVVGSRTLDTVIGEGRESIAPEVQERLQGYVNAYGTGVLITTVNLRAAAPPREVEAAFNDVQAAGEDEERFIDQANAYAETVIPEARGQAEQILQEANAYRDQVIARAQGRADRFSKLLTEYSTAKQVTRDRLYIEAIEDVLSTSSKVLMDVEGGNNMIYLPLDRLARGGMDVGTGTPQVTQDVIRQITDAVVEELNARSTASQRGTRR